MDPHLKNVRYLANLLDNKFNILGFKFGLDPILGMIPWFGDLAALGLSLYIIWTAKNMGAPQSLIARMGVNVFLDFFMGSIPVLGDIADFFYKPNKKNLDLLERFATGSAKAN
jgi:hypothetical protein